MPKGKNCEAKSYEDCVELGLVLLLAAPPVDIQDPAHLAPFFAGLRALETGDAADNLDIVVFGNSLICADNIVNIVRKKLQQKFGAGGRGLLMTERLIGAGYRSRAGTSPGGWGAFNLAQGPHGDSLRSLSRQTLSASTCSPVRSR